MIPKIIHYCWFGKSTQNTLIKKCIASWKKLLPDYQIVLWNEENVDFNIPFLAEMKKNKNWAFLSDYIRMRALYDHGGIYLDTDIEVVKSFNSLITEKCFLGFESKNRLNTAVLGAEKGHPFLHACMQIIEKRHETRKHYLIAPEVANQAYSTIANKNSVKTYPEDFFYPYNPYDANRDSPILMYQDITENTYTIHHWNKAWKRSLLSSAIEKIKKTTGKLIND
jgi:mannosyltransferase OCH1-like enzyme